MAKIEKEIHVPIKYAGEIVPIVLRQPTNEELNVYLGRKTEYIATKDKKVRSCIPEARQELFDTLVLSVGNLTDDDGPVTAKDPDRIPANWKDPIIEHYIDTVLIDVKNS